MKKQYIVPQTSVVATNPAGLICLSTGTEDNTGGSATGPGSSTDQKEEAAKKNNFNVWTDDEESDGWGSI